MFHDPEASGLREGRRQVWGKLQGDLWEACAASPACVVISCEVREEQGKKAGAREKPAREQGRGSNAQFPSVATKNRLCSCIAHMQSYCGRITKLM